MINEKRKFNVLNYSLKEVYSSRILFAFMTEIFYNNSRMLAFKIYEKYRNTKYTSKNNYKLYH